MLATYTVINTLMLTLGYLKRPVGACEKQKRGLNSVIFRDHGEDVKGGRVCEDADKRQQH